MEKSRPDMELTLNENIETLWDHFEKTGSVNAYLMYAEKAAKAEELEPSSSPT